MYFTPFNKFRYFFSIKIKIFKNDALEGKFFAIYLE